MYIEVYLLCDIANKLLRSTVHEKKVSLKYCMCMPV